MNSSQRRISDLNTRLHKASKKVRILRHLSWAPSIKATFFSQNAQQIPQVDYPQYDPKEVLELVDTVFEQLDDSPLDRWLKRQGDVIATGARMLSHCGTKDFFDHSKQLYGAPTDPLIDGLSTSLDLAQQFDTLIDSFSSIDLGAPEDACHLAQTVAEK